MTVPKPVVRRETVIPFNSSTESEAAVAGARHRVRRQTLAVPEGAVIGIIPKFGWLLYQGEEEDGKTTSSPRSSAHRWFWRRAL